jgi:plasmid maintenance system antidote protein VapI
MKDSSMSRDYFSQADRFKKLRQDRLRLSQNKLAAILEIPSHKIKDIEGGKTRISAEIGLLMEERFHVDFRWLLTGRGEIEGVESKAQGDRLSIDASSLERAIAEVEAGLTRKGCVLDPAKKARLITVLYEYSLETGKPIGSDIADRYICLMT